MSEFEDLVSAAGDDLLSYGGGDGQVWPKAWATLTIDLTLMSEEQRTHIDQAIAALYAAGVTFDRGVGFGGYDLNLDWSLRGAFLNVRALRCGTEDCPRGGMAVGPDTPGFNPAYWTLYESVRGTFSRPYCSEACRTTGDAVNTANGCLTPEAHNGEPSLTAYKTCAHPQGPTARVVLHDTAPAWAATDGGREA